MLTGIDISHHNKNMKDLSAINDYDFVIMKATEGTTYKDPAMRIYNNNLKPHHLKGFYHYCRPENKNSAIKEAEHFIKTVTPYLNNNTILAIDVEGDALKLPPEQLDTWVRDWCKVVYDELGVKPLIYTSEYYAHWFKKTCAFNVGLWCAKWSILKPSKSKIKPWNFYAIWQKSSHEIVSGVRCDFDIFNGTREQYLKYCYKDKSLT